MAATYQPLSGCTIPAPSLRLQIQRKLDYSTPYYGRLGDVVRSETDFDNFPYNRFYRSVYNSPYPAVYSRKAGYRVLENEKYKCPTGTDVYNPDLCFMPAATTTYPCYPAYFYEYANEIARNNALNRYRVNTST